MFSSFVRMGRYLIKWYYYSLLISMRYRLELGTRKPRVSCFVYIDTNTKTPSIHETNTKTPSKHETNTKNRKIYIYCTPISFKSYHSPLRSRLSPIQLATLMIVSSNSISYSLMWLCTKFSQTELYYKKQFFILLYNILQFRNTKF